MTAVHRGTAVATLLAAGLLRIPSVQAQAPVTVNVDAAAARRRIDPRVYGVNFASQAQLEALNVPLNRWGGNSTTRYNWQVNADNRANDWYYESIASGDATPAGAMDSFVGDTKAALAEPMLTIPTIGWVAKLGANRSKLASYSVAKYGAQTGTDWQWYSDAGNGVQPNGTPITWNDPNDASVPSDAAFQQGLVQHLVNRWGAASAGGVRYYLLDNEPSIWFSTHRDVHNVGPGMDEILGDFLDYGAKIKLADPGALIAGPEEWGWSGYFYSGADQQYGGQHGWGTLPDRIAHGNKDYLPWLLDQLHQHQVSTGVRLLDVFTVHYYPQGGEFGNATDDAMSLRRNRSTRSLWDPNYVDETWISDKVRLIPRLRQWVDTYFPGTQIGITEYSWGADAAINGATTQADVLGIFGREGLDLATRWVVPDTTSVTFKAFQMYRNYDGNKSTFGDVSVSATGPNPDQTSVFAARRNADGALTIMAVNKVLSGTTNVAVNLSNFLGRGTAQVYRLTSANAISHPSDVAVTGNTFTASLPAQSVTLFVLADRPNPVADFDDDFRTDFAVYHQASGLWFVRSSITGTTTSSGFGGAGYQPVSADYDGDGASDQAVYHQATGSWVIRLSASGATVTQQFGGAGYAPVPRDYDGDGKADIAVYHEASGLWYVRQSSNGATVTTGFGGNGYQAVPADYDGDGKADIAVYHRASAIWYVRQSATSTTLSLPYGQSGYVPVPRDYDGDGKADIAAYHEASGLWFVRRSSDLASVTQGFGGTGYKPVPADYDGDGLADYAVFHQASAIWYVKQSRTGSTLSMPFGGAGYLPVNQ